MSEQDPRAYSATELREELGEARAGRSPADLARIVLPPIVGLVLLGVAWQLVAAHYASNVGAFASLGAIWQQLTGNLSMYGYNSAITLEEVAIGLSASFVVAFSLAVVMTYVQVVERAVMPIAVILNVTPIVAIVPGLTLTLGIGTAPRYTVTALIVFFPLLINSLVGLGNVDPEALDLLHTLHASRREVLLRLRIPSSLPYLLVAARICFPLGAVGAVVAEFSTGGATNGLGQVIVSAAGTGPVAAVDAAIFCLAVMGLVLTLIVSLVERHFLAWNPMGRRRLVPGRSR